MADKVLDAKGLNCPLPIIKAKKTLKEVPAGGTLEILQASQLIDFGPTPFGRSSAEALSTKGVEFVQEPISRYGQVDAGFRDPSGNGWKMIERQRKETA